MREYYIEYLKDMLRVAVVKENRLENLFIEDLSKGPLGGDIYCGKVENILKGNNSAFVNIGSTKNAYLMLDREVKRGDMVTVEVLKGEEGTKGAKVTQEYSLPGKYCVVKNGSGKIRFSKSIKAKGFKQRILKQITPVGIDVMIRSAGEAADINAIASEIEVLSERLAKIEKAGQYSVNSKILYSTLGAVGRFLRGVVFEEEDKVIVNSEKCLDLIKNELDGGVVIEDKVIINNSVFLFIKKQLENQILDLTNKEFMLPSSGSIVIDETEAMNVIDINSGKRVNAKNTEEWALKTNLEAIEEIGRYIKLINISGIIIIDCLNMKDSANKEEIVKKLKVILRDDMVKNNIELLESQNLIQVVRRKQSNSIYELITEKSKKKYVNISRISLDYLKFIIWENIQFKLDNTINSTVNIELNSIYRSDIERNMDSFLQYVAPGIKGITVSYSEEELFNIKVKAKG